MEVKDEIVNYSSGSVIETTNLIPLERNLERNRIILKLEKIIKRAIDIVGGVFGIIFLIPLTIVIGIANIILKDKGPIFFFF